MENTEKITVDILLNAGFTLYRDKVLEKLTEEDLEELHKDGYYPEKMVEYEIVQKTNNGYHCFITMKYDMSNSVGRDWGCHIDNHLRESVAFVDIGTVEQFNKLMDLMEINFRIN